MSSFTSLESAFAISTSCCLPTPMSPAGTLGFTSRPTRRSRSAALALVSFQLMNPRVARSLPRKMFSATDRNGDRASSWWMMTTPLRSLSLMSRKETVSPSRTMSPS